MPSVLASGDVDIENRVAALGYDFLEWNMPWQKGLILFRHMLAAPHFEARIDDVPPIKEGMTDFTSTEGTRFIGDFSPQGLRMKKRDFLEEYRLE